MFQCWKNTFFHKDSFSYAELLIIPYFLTLLGPRESDSIAFYYMSDHSDSFEQILFALKTNWLVNIFYSSRRFILTLSPSFRITFLAFQFESLVFTFELVFEIGLCANKKYRSTKSWNYHGATNYRLLFEHHTVQNCLMKYLKCDI